MARKENSRDRAERRYVLFAPTWYDEKMHLGAARYAREAGWVLVSSMRRRHTISHQWKYDGILTILCHHYNDVIDFVKEQDLPTVDMSCNLPDIRLPRVVADSRTIGQRAANHLIGEGLSHLAFHIPCYDYASRKRLEGFRFAARPMDIDVRVIDTFGIGIDEHGIIEGLTGELSELPLPCGLMCVNDHLALLALEACNMAGLDVPEEISIVGVDNDTLTCEFAPVPLSSISSNQELNGYMAAQLLDRLMEGEEPPVEPILVPAGEVVVRQSSNLLSVQHRGVACAMAYIRKNYRNPALYSAEVARKAHMSRMRLHTAFVRHIGHSVSDEIRRLRIQEAQRLLRDSDEKIGVIAERVGFSSGQYMAKVIKKELGVTPRELRPGLPSTRRSAHSWGENKKAPQ